MPRSRWPLRACALALCALWLWLGRAGLFAARADLSLAAVLLALPLAALAGALVSLALRRARVRPARFTHALLALAAAGSWALTSWYQLGPMRARLISRDGSLYLLQARAMSHFHWGMPTTQPLSAHAAHFLFRGADGRLHGVFAPGFPLFLVPFVWLGHPLWAGGVCAALCTVATYALTRSLRASHATSMLAVALSLLPFVRTAETADLLSHALVGALSSLAFVTVFALRRHSRWPLGVALGLCAGWVFATRMLDGLVLGAVLGPYLLARAFRKQFPWRILLVALLCALPFAGLVAWQQKVATGSFRTPTSVAYVRNGDWPPDCLHLGFGPRVGCSIEHAEEVRSFGPDGFTPDDGLRLVRERTAQLGSDLYGLGALVTLAFLAVLVAPSGPRLLTALYPVGLTLAYGLFYYGNHPLWGARHLYPAAPFLQALTAVALMGLPGLRRYHAARGALALSLLALCVLSLRAPWQRALALTADMQRHREEILSLVQRQHLTRGLVLTRDNQAFLQAFDPWRDGPELLLLHDDRSGLLDVRRFHPTLPVYFSDGDRERLVRLELPALPPGMLLELERGWPTTQRVFDCAASPLNAVECCGLPASGGSVLVVTHAVQGSRYELEFDLSSSGVWLLRLDGVADRMMGQWEFSIDGAPLGTWDGYAPSFQPLRREWGPVRLQAGRHTLRARVLGHAPGSSGFDAAWDVLYALPLGVQ